MRIGLSGFLIGCESKDQESHYWPQGVFWTCRMNTYEMNLLISTDLEVLSHYFGQFSTFLLQLKSENLFKKTKQIKNKIWSFYFNIVWCSKQYAQPKYKKATKRNLKQDQWVSNTRLLKVGVFGELFLPGQVTMTTESITYSVRGYVQSFGVKPFFLFWGWVFSLQHVLSVL